MSRQDRCSICKDSFKDGDIIIGTTDMKFVDNNSFKGLIVNVKTSPAFIELFCDNCWRNRVKVEVTLREPTP